MLYRTQKDSTGWTLHCPSHRDGAGWFLALFLVAWIIGGVTLGPKTWNDPDTAPFLLAVLPGVYGVSLIAITVLALYALFGRKTIRLDGDGFFLESRILLWSRSLRIPLAELRYFEAVFPTPSLEDDESDENAAGIRLVSLGPERLILDGLRDEILALLPEMNTELADLKIAARLPVETPPEPVLPDKNVATEDAGEVGDDIVAETFSLDTPARELMPPSDSRWTLDTEFDRLRFRNRGRFQPFAFLMFLGLAIFWNGIISVFIAGLLGGTGDAPEGVGWWALFVFLIPFEVVGVIFLGMLLAVSLEPLRTTTLEFSRDQYARQTSWFGLGYPRRRSLVGWNRMELHCRKSKKYRLEQARTNNMPFDRIADWRIIFWDDNNTKLAELIELTEGEARWMADVLLAQRRLVQR